MIDPVLFNSLRRFRAGVDGACGARRDALCELLDAATVAGLVPSLGHLSLTTVHRRRWGSLYDALAAPWGPPGGRDDGGTGAAAAGGAVAPGRRTADLCAGPQRLAARRCRDQPGARLPLVGLTAVGRPADRRRLVRRLAGAGELHAR